MIKLTSFLDYSSVLTDLVSEIYIKEIYSVTPEQKDNYSAFNLIERSIEITTLMENNTQKCERRLISKKIILILEQVFSPFIITGTVNKLVL